MLAGEDPEPPDPVTASVVKVVVSKSAPDPVSPWQRQIDGGRGEFVNIVLERGGVITLARDRVNAEQSAILFRYGVSSDRSVELASPADRTD